jgi:hypothetical protein
VVSAARRKLCDRNTSSRELIGGMRSYARATIARSCGCTAPLTGTTTLALYKKIAVTVSTSKRRTCIINHSWTWRKRSIGTVENATKLQTSYQPWSWTGGGGSSQTMEATTTLSSSPSDS